jgi:hypothetical protein
MDASGNDLKGNQPTEERELCGPRPEGARFPTVSIFPEQRNTALVTQGRKRESRKALPIPS